MIRQRKRVPRLATAAGVAFLLAAAGAPAGGGIDAGVRIGDAVPGVIKKSDLNRIRRRLDLDRFSVVAAVTLGAGEGREAVVVEPLSDANAAKVAASCKAGPFCPDRLGFVASRIRIVRLQDNDVESIVTIDEEARGPRGRLLDMKEIKARGAWIGWGGWPEAEANHVALALMPVVEKSDGSLLGASEMPIRIQWSEKAGRFLRFVCFEEREATSDCQFMEEVGG